MKLQYNEQILNINYVLSVAQKVNGYAFWSRKAFSLLIIRCFPTTPKFKVLYNSFSLVENLNESDLIPRLPLPIFKFLICSSSWTQD